MNSTFIVRRAGADSQELSHLLPLQYRSQNNSVGPEMPETDMYNSADGGFFYAGGIKRAVAAKRKRKNEKLAIKKIKATSKAQAKVTKAQAKQTKATAKVGKQTAAQLNAKAQQAAAKALGKSAPAPAPRPAAKPPVAPKKGLSTLAWVGIAAAGLALIGGGIYLATRKK